MGINILKNEKVLLFVLLLTVGLALIPLLGGFFQQDEWFSFTIYLLHRGLDFTESLKFFFAPNIGHYNPLTNATQQILFSGWGMNYAKFALLGIILHLLVVTAFYFLAKLLFEGNKTVAFIAALTFGLFASSYQGISWVVANISTLSASLLGVISTIFFFNFLKGRKRKFLLWSLVLLVISLFFKEITIGLFPFFFLIYLRQDKKTKRANHLWLIGGVGISYLLLRVSMLWAPNLGPNELVTQSQSFVKLIYNFVTIPLKVLSQSLFPVEFLKIISAQITGLLPEKLTGVEGSPEFEVFMVKRTMEALSILTSLFLLSGIGHLLLKKQNSKWKNLIIYGLGWVIINSFIFSFSPEQPNVIFAVDSRNLYFTAIGVIIFIASVFWHLTRENFNKFLLMMTPVLLFNFYWLNRNLNDFIKKSRVRKYILNEISTRYPNLPERAIFYTESDISYYGLPEETKILPFQSGLGQTLLVWYFDEENYPDEFYTNRFLWEITDQGYQEVNSKGFGYFRDLGLLEENLKAYNLPKESVIAFRWNSEIDSLIDITPEIRKAL